MLYLVLVVLAVQAYRLVVRLETDLLAVQEVLLVLVAVEHLQSVEMV
jgi:hypothetical protein